MHFLNAVFLSLEHNDNGSHKNLAKIIGGCIGGGGGLAFIIFVAIICCCCRRKCLSMYSNCCVCIIYIAS